MLALCWLLLGFASGPTLTVDDGGTAPAWVTDQWTADGTQLLAGLGDWDVPLPAHVALRGGWSDQAPSRLNIRAEAMAGRVRIVLSGDAWGAPSASARLLLRQNLAHELAHQWQLAVKRPADEPGWFHEGMAEALALTLLTDTGLGTPAEAILLGDGLRSRCARALREGPLESLRSRDATYGCGFVIIEALAGEVGGSVALQRRYAAHQGSFDAFLDAVASVPLRRSVDRFRRADLTRAAPGWAFGALRAGRL